MVRNPRATRAEIQTWAQWGAELPRPPKDGHYERGWRYLTAELDALWDNGYKNLPYKLRLCRCIYQDIRRSYTWYIPNKAQEFALRVRRQAPHVAILTLATWLDLGPWYCMDKAEEEIRLARVTTALERLPEIRT